MTKLLSEREVGGVPLLTVEMSEGEAEVLLGVLDHFLTHAAQSDIESLTGAYPDEVKGIRDDIYHFLGQPEQAHSEEPIIESI
jgi:hypothetical protein